MIICHLSNFDGCPISFHIENGGCVIRVFYGLYWRFCQSYNVLGLYLLVVREALNPLDVVAGFLSL